MTSRSARVVLVAGLLSGGCNTGIDFIGGGDLGPGAGSGDSGSGDTFVGDSFVGDSAPAGDTFIFTCPTCNVTADCAAGGICTADDQCRPDPNYAALCAPCSQATPCPAGMGCVLDPAASGQRYCVAPCATTDDCSNGYANCLGSPMPGPDYCSATVTCSGGRQCVTLSGQQFCECQSAADCDVFGGWACTVGQCFTAPCAGDADCTALGVSCDMSNGVCSLPCTTDDECTCLGGVCAFSGVPCTTAADCTFDCAVIPVGGRNVGMCITESWFCSKQVGVGCNLLTGGADVCPGL